jgi:hypothetical protein
MTSSEIMTFTSGSLQELEVLWEGVVKVDPSISSQMQEGAENGVEIRRLTFRDKTFPYADNAQLDNSDLANDFPNDISIFVKGGKILEYMNCQVIKEHELVKVQKRKLFNRRKQEKNENTRIVAKGFILSPMDTTIGQKHVGCLACVQISNEYHSSLILEKTGLFIFASGSKTSEMTFTSQNRSVTVAFIATNEKPFIAYIRSKPILLKLHCDTNGVKTETILHEANKDLPSKHKTEDPLGILKVRLAKGEISIDEYNKLKKLISDDEEKLDQGSNWI